MFLSDQWAERHILDAQSKGEFDNLPGAGYRWYWMMTAVYLRNCVSLIES